MFDLPLERICPRCEHREEKPRAVAAFRRRKRRRFLIAVIVVATAIAVAAGAIALGRAFVPPPEGTVTGRLRLTLPGGAEELAPRECLPSTRLAIPEFHGVGLLGPAPTRRALIVGREVEEVTFLALPSEGAYFLVLWHRDGAGAWVETRLGQADCARFDVELSHKRPSKYVSFADFEGRVDIACRQGALGLEGRLEFEHCNGDPSRGVRSLE